MKMFRVKKNLSVSLVGIRVFKYSTLMNNLGLYSESLQGLLKTKCRDEAELPVLL